MATNVIEPKNLKGFRDFLPEEARKRQFVINTLTQVFMLYGFEPLETPTLEFEEILTGKYGQEGDKLMYRFQDLGQRNVAMRYDQTVPLARVIAQYQNEIAIPFKRYQIQPVFRAENTQKGRYREFVQCDIDTVGIDTSLADAEVIATVANAYTKLGFKKIKILINDRENLKFINKVEQLSEEENIKVVRSLDKLKKIGRVGVVDELKASGFSEELAEMILQEAENRKPTPRLQELLNILPSLGVLEDEIEFCPTLARGLDYYTGLIFEVEIEDYPVGSVGGGGRYDRLIGMFAGKDIPAVGFAFGFDRTIEAMSQLDLFPKEMQATKVLVTIFSPDLEQKSLELGSQLRLNNINAEIYLDSGAKMEKQLRYADAKNIPFVAIIGPDEARQNYVTLKNLKTSEQKQKNLEELIQELKEAKES